MLLLSTMNSQLEAVQQRICTVKGRILRSQQDLVAAKEAKNEKQERLLYELLLSPYTQVNALYKQLNGLQEKKNILLHSQAQSKPCLQVLHAGLPVFASCCSPSSEHNVQASIL